MNRVNETNPFLQQLQQTGKTVKGDETTQDAFLKLMTAQLQHQDPMEPMQSGQFLSQIAQFTTASGIHELKNTFEKLQANFSSSQALQASTLVGKQVLLPTHTAHLEGDRGVDGKIRLQQSTTDLQIKIYDAKGQLIRSIPKGMQAAGDLELRWDGTNGAGQKMPDGVYEIRAQARIDDKVEEQQVSMYTKVQSISLSGGMQGIILNLEDIGVRNMSDVLEIR